MEEHGAVQIPAQPYKSKQAPASLESPGTQAKGPKTIVHNCKPWSLQESAQGDRGWLATCAWSRGVGTRQTDASRGEKLVYVALPGL